MIASRTWLRHVATLALSAIAITAARADAQSRSADDAMLPRFEAASIKVNRTGHASEAIDRMGMRPDGSFRGQNIAVGVLLDVASRTTFFTAIQEQLGLKFEPARAPVDVLVIDRVEQPDPD